MPLLAPSSQSAHTSAFSYSSSFCLTALAVAASRDRDEQHVSAEYEWSQSYFYCLYAAVIYFTLATLMLVNFAGARFWHFKHDIVQSTVLLSLLLNTVLFVSVVFLGALVFAHLEGWQYTDGVYWAVVTLLTIGFGDMSPETTVGRALLFPYAILGITCLGVTLASIRRMVLDRGELGLRKRRHHKMRNEFLEKNQGSCKQHSLYINLTPPSRTDHQSTASFSMRDHDRLRVVFAEARAIQSRVSRRWKWTSFAVSFGAWIVFWFGGAAVFARCEHAHQNWSYFEGVYMAFVSLTTIGYGDLSPVSSCGRSFFVLWGLIGVPTITIVISNLEGPLLTTVHVMTSFFSGITISGIRGALGRIKSRILRSLGFDRVDPFPETHELVRGEAGQKRKIAATRGQYCVTILDEILVIVQHLDQQPLEHYSIDQWLWFGELLEGWTTRDEVSSPKQEKAIVGVSDHPQRNPHSGAALNNIKLGQFSSKSPLMGPRQEAEWFLERLAAVLRQELVTMDGRH